MTEQSDNFANRRVANISLPDLKQLLSRHVSGDTLSKIDCNALFDAIAGAKPVQMIVLACDIRKSTAIMKESVDFGVFADIIGNFVDALMDSFKQFGGFFDKFTGDGFIVYWLNQAGDGDSNNDHVLDACIACLEVFKMAESELRKNSRNFPQDIGLALGIDSGPTYFAHIANDLTIVGPTVVGATRMAQAAGPGEVVANLQFSGPLSEQIVTGKSRFLVDLKRTFRPTKEYPAGQEMWLLGFGQK